MLNKNITLLQSDGSNGVQLDYNAHHKALAVSGWFDSAVGIEELTIGVYELINALDITERDVRQAQNLANSEEDDD